MEWLCRARVNCVLAQAKDAGRDIDRVVLLVAGNDCDGKYTNPVDIAWEMDVRLPRFRFCVSFHSTSVLSLVKNNICLVKIK